ncbi:MAG: hypothetical protein SGI91_20315 [Alphaproteobacteria bacterium]|jgi:hypothetical protein|nr:hypothetical protein [Alphaproteobacteria bacterium]
MKLIGLTGTNARIDVTIEELTTISNALNETCNGIDIPEFETRVGVPLEQAHALLAELRAIVDKAR